MKKKNTQLFIFSAFLAASLFSATYLMQAAVPPSLEDANVFNTEQESESSDLHSANAAIIQVFWSAVQQFFILQK